MPLRVFPWLCFFFLHGRRLVGAVSYRRSAILLGGHTFYLYLVPCFHRDDVRFPFTRADARPAPTYVILFVFIYVSLWLKCFLLFIIIARSAPRPITYCPLPITCLCFLSSVLSVSVLKVRRRRMANFLLLYAFYGDSCLPSGKVAGIRRNDRCFTFFVFAFIFYCLVLTTYRLLLYIYIN